MILRTVGIVVILMLAVGLTIGCGGKEKVESKSTMNTAEDHSGHNHATMDNSHPGATMGLVKSSEALFTCPMHAEVVTTNFDAPCPLCKMKLERMTPEQITELRSSHPVGCPMDPIVTKGDSGMDNCPVCKMKLVKI